jgi:hypothetical protein
MKVSVKEKLLTRIAVARLSISGTGSSEFCHVIRVALVNVGNEFAGGQGIIATT